MKMKIKIMLIVLTGFWSVSNAQYLINQGADIVITPGSSLVIDGDFRNQLDGSMDNDGEVLISGDWTNNANSGDLLLGTTGTVTFNGGSTQAIDGSASTFFNNVDLQNDVALGVETTVSSNLAMNSNFVSIGTNNLLMDPGSSIIGAGPSGYIIANSSGKLIRVVGPANVNFPVGTISAFTPAILANSGVADAFGMSVFPDVRENGLTGLTISEINYCVNNTWDISEGIAGGSDLSLTAFWYAAIEGVSFDRAHSGIGHYTAGAWDPQQEVAAVGAGPYNITRSGITSLSPFAVGDLDSPMAIPVGARLDLTIVLEGPYNTGTNLMELDLNSSGYVPLNHPYNPAVPYYGNLSPEWLYAGSESVISIPANTVDWVVVQLRDAIDPASASSATIIDTQAAFVLSDGSIVALDGASLLNFDAPVVNDLFVVVYHRNHLGVISNFPASLIVDIYSYDFTTAETQAFGGSSAHKEVEPGTWAMIAADGDADGFVLPTDKTSVWLPDANLSGYLGGDYNMNGIGQPDDVTNAWLPNSNKAGQIPAKSGITGYQSQIPD